jgi:peptide/nickel transport system substrate-binding protein
MRNQRLAAIVLNACLVLLIGSALQVSAQDSLTVGQAGDAITLDPHANNGIVEASMASNIFDPLVVLDKKMEIKPGLAERWENPNPTTWIFHLRRTVKFHDGSPLTAEDVKYSIERILSWKPFGAMGGLAAYISAISSARAIDAHTVELKTDEPFGPMLRSLRTAYIVNKGWVEKITREKGIEAVSLHPMGTGAYKFVEWVPGDHLIVERNNEWWGGKPEIGRITFRQIANNATRVAALLSGEIQIATELPPRDAERVKNNPATKLIVLPGMRTVNFKFDTIRDQTPGVPGMPNPLKKLGVRMAINYAIDEDTIVKVVMNGYARPSEQLASDAHFGWSPNIKRLPYDPAKARQLLAEAGYPHGFPLRVDSTNNRYVNDEEICLSVAQMLNKVGIQATCRARPKQVVFKEIYDPKTLCCSMFIFSFVTPTADMAGNLEPNFHTPTLKGGYGAYNGTPETPMYSNPKADALIDAAAVETNEAKRLKLLQGASETIMADYPIVPLHYQADLYGMSRRVEWTPRPDYFLTMYDAKLVK